MADSKIPVEIEVRLDERSVGVSMESLKSRVKAQGRELGQLLRQATHFDEPKSGLAAFQQQMDAIKKAGRDRLAEQKRQEAELFKIQTAFGKDYVKWLGQQQAEAIKIDKAITASAAAEARKKLQAQMAFGKDYVKWLGQQQTEAIKVDKAITASATAEARKKLQAQMAFGKDYVKWLGQQQAEALRMNKDFNKQQAAASMFVGPQLPKSFRSQNLMTGVLTGNTEATRTMAKLHEQALMMNSEFGKTPPMLERINRPFQKIALLTTELTRAFFGLSLAVGAVGLPAILGGRYLSAMETAQNGMAGILVSMAEADGRTLNFAEASKIAADNIAMLGKEAVRTGNDSKALIDTFRSILAPGLGAGMDIDQIRQVAIVGGAAVKAIGLPVTQQIQEIRDLVAGGITPASSTLATALGLKDKDIKEMRESAEGLFVGLMNRLKGFAEMTDETFKTLSGKITIFGEVVNQTMAKSFVGTFDSFKNLVDAATSIFGEIDRKTGEIKFNDSLMEDLSLMDRTLSTILDTVTLLVQKYAELGREKVDIFGTQTNLRTLVENASGLALFAALARDNLLKAVGAVGMLTKAFGVLSAFLAGFRLGDWAYENFEIVRKSGAIIVGSFVEVTERATQVGNAIQNLFGAIVASIGLVIGDLIDTVVTRAKSIPDMIKMVVTSAMSWIASGLEKLGAGDFAKKLMSSFTFSDAAAKYDSQIDALAQRQKSRSQQFSDVWSQAATNIAEVNIESANKIDIAWSLVSETQSNAQVQASRKVEAEVARVAKMTSAETSIIVKAAEDAAKKLNAAEHQKQFYEGLIKTSKDQLEKLNTILANPSGKSAEEIKKIKQQADQLKKVIPEIESGLAKMMNKEFSKSPAAKSLKEQEKTYEDFVTRLTDMKIKADESMRAAMGGEAPDNATIFVDKMIEKLESLGKVLSATQIKAFYDMADGIDATTDATQRYNAVVKPFEDATKNLFSKAAEIGEEAAMIEKYGDGAKATAIEVEKLKIAKSKLNAETDAAIIAARMEAAALVDLQSAYKGLAQINADLNTSIKEAEAESMLMFVESEQEKVRIKAESTAKMIDMEWAKAEAAYQAAQASGVVTPDQAQAYMNAQRVYSEARVKLMQDTSLKIKNIELKDAKETVDKIEGTFKELFVGMASEGGKNWKEMLNKFKTSFKTDIIEYIYKQLAKPFVLNVIASVTGAMGMSGVSQAASSMAGGTSGGGGSGILGTANNLWTAYRSGEMMNTLGEFGAGASAYYGGASQVPGMSLGVDSGMLGNVSNAPGAAGWGATAAQYAPIAGGMAAGYNTAGRIGGVKGMAAGAAVGVGTAAAMGAAGSMMAGGTAAAGASSAMGTLSAMGPVGWVAAAVLLAYSAFSKKGGGPQIGEYGGVDEKGYKSSFTASGGDPLNNKGFAEVTYGQAQSLYAMVGLDAGKITLEQGYGLDPQGDSPGKTYRNLRLNGKTLTGDTFDGNNGAQWYGGNADTQGAATYLSKLTNSEIEALVKAIDNTKLTEIMAKLKANFSDLTEGMAKYQTAQATQKSLLGAILSDEEKQKRHLAEVTEYLNKAFADINMAVPTTTEGFRKLIDGVDLTTVAGQTLLQQLGAMGDAFLFVANAAKAAQQEQYGWQIKLDIVQGKYTEQQAERFFIWHAAANDSTRAIISQVWALEDQKVALEDQKVATDAATESLKEMQAVAMKGVDNAFGELVSAYESEISVKESLIDKTKDYIRQLKDFSRSLSLGELSTLDPLGKYQAAKSAFDAVSQRAMSGDSAAIGQLQGVSEAYLQASREYYASNVQYADDYNKVQSAINKTVSVAEQQVDSMDAQLITMRRQLSSLTQINESTKSVESAITRLQTALLEAVRVGNIGDVSEQAKTASGPIKGGAGELYNPLTDTWSNKGQSATTSQIREWGGKILNEQGPMALYDAVNSVGLSLSSVNVIAGWKAGTAEDWVKANIGNVSEQAKMASGPIKGDVSEQAKTASGPIKGGAGELYNPLTDTWSNKGQSATTSQIREWGAKILNEQGPMALYEATKSVGLSLSSVNVIAGWEAGTAENWAKANNLPTFANGGFVKPGWAMVGERGPELVNFATQARVYTADQTSRMISGSGDNEVYLQQVIAELQALIRQNGAASQAMIAELQQVKAELEDLRSRTRLRDGTNG